MESYAARLASFNAAYPPTKKRASNTSSGKTLKWPHKNPSPPELALAGFFYQPTSSCPDNTRCYLCKSNLDSWEENDNAVEEHLKLSPNCGWAITIATELENEDGSQSQADPMSERILDARRMTFGSRWPHENKRGWSCKTQKMIEAGWYYCPTLESEDFVKCSYCNLSLDGWEPKDNPHDEHQRRSPNCVFFALSTTAKPKAGRSKKGRGSKAPRMSTQSNFTVSDGISIAENDVGRDDSIMSVVEPTKTAKSAKGAKKGAKAKKPSAKSKRQASKVLDENIQVASSFLEPEDDDFEVKVEAAPQQSKGNKKRKSDEMNATDDMLNDPEVHSQEQDSQDQPRKRRTTKTRGVMARTSNAPSLPHQDHDLDPQMTYAETIPAPVPIQGQRKGKGGKKRGSSNARKASIASTASKASLRATMPPNEDIEAALEAELDRPLTDEEGDIEPPAMAEPKGRRLTRTKSGSRKATASVAPTRRTTRASTVTVDDSAMQDVYPSLPDPTEEPYVPAPEEDKLDASVRESPKTSLRSKQSEKISTRKASEQQKAQEKKVENTEEAMADAQDKKDEELCMKEPPQPRSKLASRQLPAHNTRTPNTSSSLEAMDLASDMNISRLDTQAAQDDSGHETDASAVKQAHTKRGSKKAPAKKVKGGKKAALMSRNIEDIVQPIVDDAALEEQGTHTGPIGDRDGTIGPVFVEVEEPMEQREPSRVSAEPDKTKKTLPEPEAFMREGSEAPLMDQPSTVVETETICPSPQPRSARSTPRPAPSTQSSDAENQPPSSRPSNLRSPLSMQSPSKSQISRVPLAATTPVSSPSRNNISKLQTTFPWTAIEMEHIFEGTPTADKENGPFAFGEAGKSAKILLTSPEKKLTVEQWIQSNAQRGEEKLRTECERLVGRFEDQGVRAMRVLEGIVCAERL
ncbi:MAG: hypothetical protein ASARMPRED_003850 [Alectoria sarmentosa]|nr:MAG: hypothetical protein ASARMPRED_003850 [Alectoria sarmentosa]